MKTVELLMSDEDKMGIQAVSLVEFPAIEENFVYFNSGDKYTLAKVDEEKQMLVGAALIPDKKIPRIDEMTGEEYEVFFSASTVRKASERYMLEERTNQHTYEHEVPIKGVTVVESWIIEDPEKDKSALYGFKLPAGTWMLSVKVHNPEIWKAIKDKKVRGFSIEGYFMDKIINASKVDVEEEILTELKELVLGEMKPELMYGDLPAWKTKEDAELYGVLFAKQETEEVQIKGGTYWIAKETIKNK